MYNYNNTNSCNNLYSSKSNCTYNLASNITTFPKNYMYGQSYVPWQEINNTFDPAKGLNCGTIFPELYSAYRPCQSLDLIKYLELSSKGGCAK